MTGSARATRETESTRARPRGRPREFDHDQVLEAALTYFWQRGIRATTRELEQALGLSQSSIYNAFGSKQGLLDQALDRYEVQATEALIAPIAANPDGLAAVEEFFVNLKNWIVRKDRRGCLLINLMAEDGNNTPTIAARAGRYRARVRQALVDALKRATVDDRDANGRADLLMCLVLGFNVAARGGASNAELNRLLQSVFAQCRSWRPPLAA